MTCNIISPIKARHYLSIILLLITQGVVLKAKAEVSQADYQRAALFQTKMRDMVHQATVQPGWLPENKGFWYLAESKTAKVFKKVSFATLSTITIFDQTRLAKLLTEKFDIETDAKALPFNSIEFIDDQTIEFIIEKESYSLNLNSYAIDKKEVKEENSLLEQISPDGKWIAFSKNYNLYLRSVSTGKEYALSTEGKKYFEYAIPYGWYDTIEGEDAERPQSFSVQWSPDSKRLLTSIWDFQGADKMYLLDWSIEDRYRPTLLSYYRGSPGEDSLVKEIPVIFDVENKKEIRPDLPSLTHINSANLQWAPDSQYLIGDYWERGFKKLHLFTVQNDSGRVDDFYNDESETNIDFTYFNMEKVMSADEKSIEQILITSERSGWNQIYSIDLKAKKFSTLLNSELIEDKFVVKKFIHLDKKNKILYFTASGKEKGNPYFNYAYRVNLDGSDLTLLTPENVNHDVFIEPGAEYFIDNYSTPSQPTTSVLRSTKDGSVVLTISHLDADELFATGWQAPEIFSTTAKDGKTNIYGAIWKPTNFDSSKKYPVIDASYTGPHTQIVPNSFSCSNRYGFGCNSVFRNTNQALAELGFIVVAVDGLGTVGRSKAFHNWSYKRLAFGLEDHVLAIKELGKRYTWIDTSKVGIFGHSAGGYDATQGLLRFPDFYKVAVSSSADHDHRMEKAWWPEMYMGWPVDEAYQEQSNITMAANLKGKLLITHGGIDENVNPSASFKLAEALVKADKDFDMLIFPSSRHGYSGDARNYFIKKRWNYFIEHLLGAKPSWPIKFPK